MTKLEKLIARIRARPPEADFDDVRRLLEAYGYTLRQGEHQVFRKLDAPVGKSSISVPTVRGRKVKRYILDQICGMLDLG